MGNIKGVFEATKKDGTKYYRASLTYLGKHISLGSFLVQTHAGKAVEIADEILNNPNITIDSFINDYHDILASDTDSFISLDKVISLINYRDNKIYIANPIYIYNKYFYYYLSVDKILKFDADELFFYSSHKIMYRGNHLFVSDYDSQLNILSRYGIRPHSILGKDYLFKNGDRYDFRITNIEIINKYYGVSKLKKRSKKSYKAVIHIKNNFTIGYYESPIIAAIAYNKAADILNKKGYSKEYPRNDISIMGITKLSYIDTYNSVSISEKIRNMNF